MRNTRVQIDEKTKLIASEVFKQYDMSRLRKAINLFCEQVAMTNSITLELKVPTDWMKKALKELEKREGKSLDSIEALKADLES